MFSAATKTGSQAAAANYIEDVFSTYLYTGTGATQSINNGIDLAGKGGLIWCKTRNVTNFHSLVDTARGASKWLGSNSTSGEDTFTDAVTSFNNNGFTLGADTVGGYVNLSPYNFVSWTFRKQPKFFDVVTWTGDGTNYRQIPHNLGSSPGFLITKQVSAVSNWWCYHRSLGDSTGIQLESTAPANTTLGTYPWDVTNTTFQVSSSYIGTNTNGVTYVAYLFAHNAGGFGTSGTDNVISCCSFTTDGSGNATVSLGYEPQYVMWKASSASGNWFVEDSMRAFNLTSRAILFPNLSNAEATGASAYLSPNATGFSAVNSQLDASTTYIYMAIRRPMKVPTDATTVFSPNVVTPNLATNIPSGITNDAVFLAVNDRTPLAQNYDVDRLRGTNLNQMARLRQNSDGAEQVINSYGYGFDNNTKIVDNFLNTQFGVNTPCTYWNFSRRPGFFDIVCYTGTGSATTQAHNLGVVPELMIIKDRLNSNNWAVYAAPIGNTKGLILNNSSGESTSSTLWNDTSPTSSVFTLGTNVGVNGNPAIWGPYVAYLFATCPGVSKVGSYTGNATGQSISCGFTGGARFVLIKRTDTTGNWYIFDTANGMTSTSSPYLLMNDATVAQVTGNNGVFGSAGGFTLGLNAASTTNIISASYIFLAIA